jgi:hypothetical protein
MINTKTILSLLILFFANEIIAQKVKDEDLTFKYKRLASSPINKTLTSYKGEVVLAYEEDDKKKKEEFEQKKVESNAQYEKDKKAADLKNEKEKEEYRKQSFGKKFVDKVILEQDNRPKKEYVSKEDVGNVFIHKKFDKELLASTYIKFEGYEKSNNAKLKVTFTAFGIEWLEPSTTEGRATALGGTTAGQPQKKYSTQIKYRCPVAVKVESADGAVILNETVEKTNEYRSLSSAMYDSPQQAQANAAPEKILPLYEQKIMEDNMKIANDYLNEKCATSVVERKTILYNVESKKMDYSDFQQAYTSAIEGYTLFLENQKEASVKIKSAIAAWDKALKESNSKDKKARVNEEITIATIFNLAEAYIWTNDYTQAKLVLTKTSSLDLSKKENKKVDELKLLIVEQQQRYEANKNL